MGISTTRPSGDAELRPRGPLALFAAWANVLILVLFSPAILLLLGWFTEGYQDTTDAGDVSHRLHEVLFGVLFAAALVGAATQIRRPEQNTAGFLQLCATVGLLSIFVWRTNGWESGLVLYLAPLLGLVATRSHRGTFHRNRVWWPAVLMTVPMFLALIDGLVSHLDLASAAAQNHTTHWTATAAFEGTLLALTPIVAFRLSGYRVTLATLGLSAFLYGAASLLFPFDASSHRRPFSVGLILWAAGWMVLWYRSHRSADRSESPGRPLLWIAATFGALVLSLALPALDDPPNVPHRPDPSAPTSMVADISADTCRSCHAFGREGAPVQSPSHLAQICSTDCPTTNVTCLGCHQIDPIFQPQAVVAGLTLPHPIGRANPPLTYLTPESLSRAAEMVGSR